MCHTDYLSTLIFVYFLIHLIRNRLLPDTAYCHHSHSKWQRKTIVFFVCFSTKFIQLQRCIVLSNLFYFIYNSLNHNVYWFCWYHRKAGDFVLKQKQFLQFHWYYLLMYLKSLYESYLSILKLFTIFQPCDLKPTLRCHCNHLQYSLKWQQVITVLFCYIETLIQLRCYIVSIILFLFYQLFALTQYINKLSLCFCFKSKHLFKIWLFKLFDLHKFISWVLFTII